jgi:tetratricopeptide (TPR) repeat protein
MRALGMGLLMLTLAGASATAQEPKAAQKQPDLSLTAVGRQHHAIATKNKEAQDYFDQGLTFIYGFNHEEAGRAFQRASELDPVAPMPLWGIALAVGPNYNMDVDAEREKTACESIQKAARLAGNGPQAERDYVAALSVRYSAEAKPDYKKLAREYAAATRKLMEKYPDDLDAATLYAESLMDLNPWRLWSPDGKAGENTEEIIRVLESVLARDPNHAGANHYYIHAVEASGHPERALPSARRLDNMIPHAGHLVHMPAHIYIRTGDYDAAVTSNVLAVREDRKYAEEADKVGSLYDLMYHSHNEHFIAMAAAMAGRYAEAKTAADGLVKRLEPHVKMMPALDLFLMTPLWVEARFAKWDALSAAPEPSKDLPGTHAMWRYTRVLAFAAKGDTAKAAVERDAFQKETAAVPAGSPFGGQNPATDILEIAAHVMDARIAGARGEATSAVEHWQKAVQKQDSLIYDEPADWYYPVRESLGAALLLTGDAKQGEAVFREDLSRNPRNPRSLFGLHQCLLAQKREADAAWVERQFRMAWASADTKPHIKDF